MRNTSIFNVQFNVNFGEKVCELNAVIKPTHDPREYHILHVKFKDATDNDSVMNDCYIVKIIRDRSAVWVHSETKITSHMAQAIGGAVDLRQTPDWL